MARHVIRALRGIVMAGACLTLAACTSGSAAPAGDASAGQAGGQPSGGSAALRVPVKDGTVVVRQGNKVICVMKVVNGKGTCRVPATSFGVGTSQITAQYGGKGYAGSSTSVTYSVVTAGTTTALTLSPATVSYGGEQAERLSVKVTPAHGGTPTGTVAVKYDGLPVCVIKLSAAKGSCTLPARRLPVGARALTAVYAGDHWYRGSVSAAKTLTVAL